MKTSTKKLALMLAIPLFLGVATAGVGIMSTVEGKADETGLNTTLTTVPNAIGAANYGFVENDGVRYTVKAAPDLFNKDADGYGLVDFGAKDNNKLSLDGSVTMTNWKWTFNANASLVFVFEATKPGVVSFDFTPANLSGDNAFADAWNTVFSVHLLDADGETLTTLVDCYQEADRANSGVQFNNSDDIWEQYKEKLSGTYQLAEGEKLYWEFGTSEPSGERSIANVAAAKLSYTVGEAPEEQVESHTLDLPAALNENEFGFIEGTHIRYTAAVAPTLMDPNAKDQNYGLHAFDSFTPKADEKGHDVVKSSAVSGTYLEDWKWYIGKDGKNESMVLIIEAKENGVLKVDLTAGKPLAGWLQPWPMIFRVYHLNKADGTMTTLRDYMSGKESTGKGELFTGDYPDFAAKMTITETMKAGDILFYEVGTQNGNRNMEEMDSKLITFMPESEDMELVIARQDAQNKVDAAYGTLEDEKDLYTETEWAKIETAYTSFNTLIKSKTTVEEIEALRDETLTAMQAAKKDDFLIARKAIATRMKNLFEDFNEDFFSEEDYAKLQAIYDEFNEQLAECTDVEGAEELFDTQYAKFFSEVQATQQVFDYLNYPSFMNANGYDWIRGHVFDTKLCTGTVGGTILDFDAQGKTEHIMYNKSLNEGLDVDHLLVYAENWRWRVYGDMSVIAAYKAHADMQLEIVCTRMSAGTDKVMGWTDDTVLVTYIVRGGVAKKIASVNAPRGDADISATHYLKAGDMIYIEYSAPGVVVGDTRDFQTPCNTIARGDSTKFDQAKYEEQNHDLAQEVLTAIEEKTQALRDYYAGLKQEDYSATNWLSFEQHIDMFIEKCESEVDTVEDVTALYESTLASMKAVQTLAQAQGELQGIIDGYLAELQAAYDDLVAKNTYTDENKAALDKALADGKEAIGKAASKAAANSAKLAAVQALNSVPYTGGGSTDGEEGCGSLLTGTASVGLLLIAAGAAVCVILRKKRD